MLQLIIGLALIGFILWLVLTYIPMPDPIKKLIMVIVCICVVLWVAGMFGVLPPIPISAPPVRRVP